MTVLNKKNYTKGASVVVAMSAVSASATAESKNVYTDIAEEVGALHLEKKNPATGQSTYKIKVPVKWDDEAKQRFNQLMALKSQKKTSKKEDEEFAELYDARSEYYGRTSSEQAVSDFRRKRAFNELVEAFDKYVIAEKIAH